MTAMRRAFAIARTVLLFITLALQAHAAIVVQSRGPVYFPTADGGGGELAHGDTVEITGTGFGTGPTVSSLQSTIEATSVGAEISYAGSFSAPDNAAPYEGVNDADRGRVVQAGWTTGAFNLAMSWDRGSNMPTNDLIYGHYLIKARAIGAGVPAEGDDNGGCDPSGNQAWQWKLWRFRYNNDYNDSGSSGGGLGDFYTPHWENEDGSYFGGEFSPWHWVNCASSGSAPQLAPFVNNASGRRAGGDDMPTLYTQDWYKVEIFISAATGSSGRIFMYVQRDGGVRNLVGSITGAGFFDGGEAYRYLVLQNYLGDGPTGINYTGTLLAIDDFQVQRGNLRRVELCSHEDLADSAGAGGWREIQNPTDWSDTSIEVTLNTGANRTGTAWLKVIETDPTTRNDTELGSLEITISALFEGIAANDDLFVMAA